VTVRRLSGLDTSFLALDGPTSVGHLCLVAVLSGRLDATELADALAARIDRLPALREKLATVPLGLGRPFWQEDPDFRLEEHLHSAPVSGTGGLHDLALDVERIGRDRLDRGRPLWEMHVLTGLSGRRTAVVTKIHHAVVDGIAVHDLLQELLDHPDLGDVSPAPESTSRLDLLRRWGGAADLPIAAASAAGTVGLGAAGKVVDTMLLGAERAIGATGNNDDPDHSGARPGRPPLVAPSSPFNRDFGAERTIGFADVDLGATAPVRDALGVTVNDLVLAATAGAVRGWLLAQGHRADEPLQAAVPVALRQPSGGGANRIGIVGCPLPVQESDPEARLGLVHEAMIAAKQGHGFGQDKLDTFARLAVPVLATPATRLATRLRLADHVRLPYNLMVSNVPGAAARGTLCGHEVLALYPVPAVAHGLGLNVTVQGHVGSLHYGVVSAPEIVPDPWLLVDLLVEEHEVLAGLS
jgi:WS/DGAT/MGAT family acyltransferase